jgi:hypothetical protein
MSYFTKNFDRPRMSPFSVNSISFRGSLPSLASKLVYRSPHIEGSPFDTYLKAQENEHNVGILNETPPTSYQMSDNDRETLPDMPSGSQSSVGDLSGNGPPVLNFPGSDEDKRQEQLK